MEQLWTKAKNLIKDKDYKATIPVLKELTDKVEAIYSNQSGKLFSFNHILETYYYAYFMKDVSQLEYTEYAINSYYRTLGFCQMHTDKHIDAIKSYEKALKWNPVDLDTYLQLAELYKKVNNLESLRKVTFESYNFLCSRATMARFYRNLGFYYLEKYEPELAAVLYKYSNIYYETEFATKELEFIAKAIQKDIPEYSLKYMQEKLVEKNIPVGPNPDTIGITYRVGQIELEAGNAKEAKECFMMVYDLTQDDEVKVILEGLENK
ncbi:MAG: hypothetical protein E7270_11690 [Lachnospiraceae bacterium]|nr:hypothetical protein [Lachnospiraceae bacterium]